MNRPTLFSNCLRIVGIVVLFCSCSLNLAAWGIQTFRNFAETTAADVAIHVPKSIATCHHHPHGCPKDCLCPKTLVTVEEPEGKHQVSGVLHEPSWVNCTEQGSKSLTPTFSVFIPEFSRPLLLNPTVLRIDLMEELWPSNPLSQPPQKIPIA